MYHNPAYAHLSFCVVRKWVPFHGLKIHELSDHRLWEKLYAIEQKKRVVRTGCEIFCSGVVLGLMCKVCSLESTHRQQELRFGQSACDPPQQNRYNCLSPELNQSRIGAALSPGPCPSCRTTARRARCFPPLKTYSAALVRSETAYRTSGNYANSRGSMARQPISVSCHGNCLPKLLYISVNY